MHHRHLAPCTHATTRLSPEHWQRPPVGPSVHPPRPAARLCRDITWHLSTGASQRGNDTGTGPSDLNLSLVREPSLIRHIASSHDNHRRPHDDPIASRHAPFLHSPPPDPRRLRWSAFPGSLILTVLTALARQCHRHRRRHRRSRDRARPRRRPPRGARRRAYRRFSHHRTHPDPDPAPVVPAPAPRRSRQPQLRRRRAARPTRRRDPRRVLVATRMRRQRTDRRAHVVRRRRSTASALAPTGRVCDERGGIRARPLRSAKATGDGRHRANLGATERARQLGGANEGADKAEHGDAHPLAPDHSANQVRVGAQPSARVPEPAQ